jgi:glycosyltransferase involved in cell wall biosynthesis
MYRKGIDLLIAAIPRLCALHPNVYFIIGGEGPKRVELEQMRERFALHDRVEMCGSIRQGEVQNVSERFPQLFLLKAAVISLSKHSLPLSQPASESR